jgi:hypothetical protein
MTIDRIIRSLGPIPTGYCSNVNNMVILLSSSEPNVVDITWQRRVNPHCSKINHECLVIAGTFIVTNKERRVLTGAASMAQIKHPDRDRTEINTAYTD